MPPIRPPSRRLIVPGFFVLMVVTALLPVRGPVGRAYQGAIGPLHAAVSALLGPVAHGAAWVGAALRFERDRIDHGQDVDALHDRIDELQNELVRMRGEVRTLRRQNRMLQGYAEERTRQRLTPRIAPVAGVTEGAGEWSLKINLGRKFDVRPGQPVVSGSSIVGRVSRASWLNAVVERIDSPGTRVDAVLAPPVMEPDAGGGGRVSAVIQLKAVGPRRFEATPSGDVAASVGEVAHLWDEAWPRYAGGRIIGRVVKVEPIPEQPLRQRVVVEAMVRYPSLKSVVVLIAEQNDGNVE